MKPITRNELIQLVAEFNAQKGPIIRYPNPTFEFLETRRKTKNERPQTDFNRLTKWKTKKHGEKSEA